MSVCINSVKSIFQVKGYDDCDGVSRLVEVGDVGIGNFAELLGSGVEFVEAKLIRISCR